MVCTSPCKKTNSTASHSAVPSKHRDPKPFLVQIRTPTKDTMKQLATKAAELQGPSGEGQKGARGKGLFERYAPSTKTNTTNTAA